MRPTPGGTVMMKHDGPLDVTAKEVETVRDLGAEGAEGRRVGGPPARPRRRARRPR